MEVEWTPLTHDELRLRRSGGVRRNTARTRNVLVKVKGVLSTFFNSRNFDHVRLAIILGVVFCRKLAPLVIMTECCGN